MFKKIISLMVAVLMIASCAVVAVSAADVTEETVAADESSSVVSADEGSSVVSAEESSEVSAASDVIKFEQPSDWKNVKSMYAHIYMCIDDGSVKWHGWKSKSEKMTDNGDGTWSYDLSKLPNGAATIDPSKGAAYAVVFAADTGMQTYNLVMDAGCIGDTAYATGTTFENPEDSNKTCIEAKWKNSSLGPEKKILSTGNDVVGTSVPAGASDATLMANWMKTFYADTTKTGNVPSLLSKLNVTGQAVYDELINITASLDAGERAKILEGSAKLLGVEYKKGDEKKTSSSGSSSSSSSSSNGGSGSGSNGGSGSSGSGSSNGSTGSVSSGQDSTILFVLGGVLFAAAAVMFVTRRRKD